MTRGWVAFALGLVVVATPLNALWVHPRLGLWGPGLSWAVLLALAAWAVRGPRAPG